MADVNEKMRDALVTYRYVQRKMLEKWSEGDERVKAGLWAALHKCEALADAALAEQPAQGEQHGGVSGWYCAHCQHGVDPVDVTFGEKHVYCGYPVTDCPAPPAPVTPDDVVKDAARYRWLRDQDYDSGCVIAIEKKYILRFVNYSKAIDNYIDAAMLAAAPTVAAKEVQS